MSKLPIVAIVGRANVGKSSLFNRFVARRQAIVSNTPGTTRDAIYAKVEHGRHTFWAVDTAGLKNPEDDFEFTIQEQITQASDSADVLLVVIEAHTPLTHEDRQVAKLALKSGKECILVVNKSDKPNKNNTDYRRLGISSIIQTSAEHNTNVQELLDEIIGLVPAKKDTTPSTALSMSFVGRPNVGKSSLFNRLAAKQQAVVADVAGTTRDVNRIEIGFHGQTIQLLDTAGIRRPGKIGRDIEHFSVLRALSAIEESDVCCLVIDATEPATKLDQKIAGMVKDAGKGLIIIVSKWDLIDKDAFTHDQMAARISAEFPYVAWAPLIFTSSISGQNVSKLFDLGMTIRTRRSQELTTPDLNKWLKKITRKHPPAGLKNARPKLQYITQIKGDQPRFKVFGTSLKYLHWSYKRYMDRELRELAVFEGTPIVFEFTEKERRPAPNKK